MRRYAEKLSYNEKAVRKALGPRVTKRKKGVIVRKGKVEIFCKSLHRARSGVRFRRLVRVIRAAREAKITKLSDFTNSVKVSQLTDKTP